MVSYDITTAPTFHCCTYSDLTSWLILNDTSQNTNVTRLISEAEEQFTNDTHGHVLCSSTWKLYLDHWPHQHYTHELPISDPEYWFAYYYSLLPLGAVAINIRRTPVTAISLVEYLDRDGTWQTLEGWTADTTGVPARVTLPVVLPYLNINLKPTVRITFTAGYVDASHIPAGAISAVMGFVNYKFAHRGDDDTGIPINWLQSIAKYDTGLAGAK
jgi:hypothetical protein